MTENLRYAARNFARYENEPRNCQKLGRLYRWEVALQACPNSWHLATEHKWQMLELTLSMPFEELEGNQERGGPAGEKIKISGDQALRFPYAGYGNLEDKFDAKDKTAAIWTANETDCNHATSRPGVEGRSPLTRVQSEP